MCCTFAPARLSKTILYAGEAMRDEPFGCRKVHVLGYQNRAENLARGPNAMILPFPAAQPMGSANVLDTSGCKSILKDYAEAIRPPRSRGFDMPLGSAMKGVTRGRVEVFDSGSYTVVLADDAKDIGSALKRVPKARRPDLNPAIFKAYSKWYPGWQVALCCFEAGPGFDSDPMIWWYVPKSEERMFMPALDAHDGRAPRLGERVAVDHTLVFGSAILNLGQDVDFTDDVPDHVMPLMASRVIGCEVEDQLPNGDFWLGINKLRQGKPAWERKAPEAR